jgi:hypothetical protein
MSDINTNGLNINYPVTGVNNNSQGFRDNFSAIKSNLDTAKTELTDLQTKAVVKSALNGTSLNNDMNNTMISNALTKGFRASTYNLGDMAVGSDELKIVNVSQGDVQYGTIHGNVLFNFAGWAPAGTKSTVELHLTIPTASAASVLSFPNSVYDGVTGLLIQGPRESIRQLENYGSNNASPGPGSTASNQVSIPQGVTELNYLISTTDCGTTIDVMPLNRNQVATRITLRGFSTETSIGVQGDAPGAVATDGQYLYVCVGNYDGTTQIWGKVPLYTI